MRQKYVCRIVLLAFVLPVCTLISFGQMAEVTGRVTDVTDAVIADADVALVNTSTGIRRESVSNEVGYYSIPLLPPGTYRAFVQKEGFRAIIRSGISLDVQQVARLDFRMELGVVTETIEVTADAPLVDTSTPTLGKVVGGRLITDLPLNGRNALALVLLTPGVKSNAGPTNTGFVDRGIQISSVSINGGPNSMNSQLLDGTNNVLAYVGEVGVALAVDAVQEFKVQSGSMAAEFGFTAGGAISLVTKSGTNQIHGSLYEFLRNDKLDARNAFARRKGIFRYNQFGGSVGGPFIKNRTFGFFNFEEYIHRPTLAVIRTFPIAEQREGNFSNLFTRKGASIPVFDPATTRTNPTGAGFIRDPFPNNMIPKNRLDPVPQNVFSFYPLPNRPPANAFTNTSNYEANRIRPTGMRQFTVKVDDRVSANNHLFVRYSQFRHGVLQTSTFPDPVASARDDNLNTKNAVISDTHTFSPTLLNEMRLGLSRQHFGFVTASFGKNIPEKLGLPPNVPRDVFPNFRFSGFPSIGNGTAGFRGSLSWEFQDVLTKIQGPHSFKLGWNHRLLRGNNFQPRYPSGRFNFDTRLTGNPQARSGSGSGLASFVLGDVATSQIDTNLGLSAHAYSTSFFVQDAWKVRPTLTLNLGLRYDFQQRPVERYDGWISFDSSAVDPLSGLPGRTVFAGIDGQSRSFVDNDLNDFGPRIGFAWDVFGTSKTVLRGGYGIYYPVTFNRHSFPDRSGFARTTTNYLPEGNNRDFPAFRLQDGIPSPPLQSLGAELGPSAFLGQSVGLMESATSTPLSQQWSMSLQQQLGSWLVEFNYTANLGSHFNAGDWDLNQLDPRHLALGKPLLDLVPNPNAGIVPGALGAAQISRLQSLRPFPHYNTLNVRRPGLAQFNSQLFIASVERRMAQGLSALFSFTSGKIISSGAMVTPVDFGPVEQVFNQRGNRINGFQNGKFDRRAERSVDPTDVSARGVITLLYELPIGPGKTWNPSSAVLKKLMGGWQFSTIGAMQTGLPLAVRGANNDAADRPDSAGQSAKLNNPTVAQWFNPDEFVNPAPFTFGNLGRLLPDVRAPGVNSWDFSVIKNTQITERVNLQFRAEAFNFANHVNLRSPSVRFVPGSDGRNQSGSFGVITRARPARVLQFGLKLVF